MEDLVSEFLKDAQVPSCTLLVHPDVAYLQRAAEEWAARSGCPLFPVGPTIAGALLSTPPRRRPAEAVRTLQVALRQVSPGPLVCTQIDVLFEPALELDPLALFRDAGRFTRLVVAWPGTYAEDTLAYAVPAHSHYHTWKRPQVTIVPLP